MTPFLAEIVLKSQCSYSCALDPDPLKLGSMDRMTEMVCMCIAGKKI
ncbi:hypothetical protein [Wolbachia endosymbiont (group A) of Anomoia purmunda]|nr:hypothetical protein [Wolbachia endosymbiont (group A) of Anomoia purmunda]